MRIEVTEFGSGRPVVFLPGMPQSMAHVEGFARRAADRGVRALVVHPPGYGASPAHRPLPTLAEVRAAIADAVSARCSDPVVLCGISGGSYQAMGIAAERLLPVAGLFLVAPLAGMPPAMAERYAVLAQLVRDGALTAEMAMPGAVSPAFIERAGRDAALAYVQGALDAVPGDVLASELDGVRLGPNWHEAMCALDLHAQLLVGELDLTTPVELVRAIAEGWTHASVRTVPGAGHDLYLEDAEATADALAAFVGR